MTEERMELIELVGKQADGDRVRAMLAFAAERIMKAEVEERTGAAKGVRSPLREVQVSTTSLPSRLAANDCYALISMTCQDNGILLTGDGLLR